MSNSAAGDGRATAPTPPIEGRPAARGRGRAPGPVRRRAAGLTASGASAALLLTGLVAVGPAATAAPTPDCAAPFPVADLVSGAPVTGLTVSKGTTPQGFTGEVLGVLSDGIAPDLDMIVAELHSPAIDAAGGIWQGMSGSPVYAEDGRLIGAVAYGLAFGSSPVAGITPYEDMQGYLGAAKAAPEVPVGTTLATRIAAETDVTRSEAAQGLQQLPMPVGVGGVDLSRARTAVKAAGGSDLVTADSYRIGRSSGTAAAAGIDTVTAGGNVAAVLSHGDITLAGIGTATSVCGDRVVGFGHPLAFTGKARLGLAAADAVYVQKDPLGVPFKVANLGDLGGTVTDDRLAGIAGTFGASPTPTPVRSTVSYHSRSRTGTTQVLDPSALTDVTLLAGMANHDRVVDGVIGGSETQAWRITGTRSGSPFTLRYADRYQAPADVGSTGAFDLAAVVSTLSSLSTVKITGVTNDVKVSDNGMRHRIVKIQQRTGGKWVDVTGKTAKVRAGKTLVLRTQLLGSDGITRSVFREEFTIPKSLKGKSGMVTVVGGNSFQDEFYGPTSFDGVQKLLSGNLRNDEARLSLKIGSGKSTYSRTRTSDIFTRVVSGQKQLQVRVTS
ncbi:SpoIVB peptidase S55 domain-containing protein [Isoptericola sp. NPDC019693]|uniref:SpoIVB peptidase S55 domain-containing protein n=1 Tax=Isoptericola sp. NPDC019693 TaxID=3364009 RepID=UPI0037A1E55B